MKTYNKLIATIIERANDIESQISLKGYNVIADNGIGCYAKCISDIKNEQGTLFYTNEYYPIIASLPGIFLIINSTGKYNYIDVHEYAKHFKIEYNIPD